MASQEEHLNPLKYTLETVMQPVRFMRRVYTMNHLPSCYCRLNAVDSSPSTCIRRPPVVTDPRPSFELNWLSRITVALVVWISCSFVQVTRAAAQDIPTGTIELSGGSVAAGIGYSWGSGTLVFEGKKYALKVDGISIVHVGVSGYTASGTVYNLKKLSDINGVYSAVSAGAAIAGGASVTAMKNSNGVLIQWVATHAGLNFSLGPKGMTIALQ